jgi:hypothetical protein
MLSDHIRVERTTNQREIAGRVSGKKTDYLLAVKYSPFVLTAPGPACKFI